MGVEPPVKVVWYGMVLVRPKIYSKLVSMLQGVVLLQLLYIVMRVIVSRAIRVPLNCVK